MDLQAKPYLNVDSSAQSGITKFYDAGKDDYMNNTRRPGLGGEINDYEIDLGESSPVDSVYDWDFQNWGVAVCGGKLFKITKSGSSYTTTEITGATLETGTEAFYADFGDTLFIANGGRIVKWQAVNNTCAYITDTDAPTTVTHLGFIDTYLMALSDGINHFADVNDPDTWEGEFFTAERLKDKTVAMHIAFSEISSFGSLSVEYHGNTGNTTLPFQRFEGAITQRGTIAPYSVQQIDNTYFFLDQERKLVKLAGRDPQVISSPFDSDFQALDVVSDARSMHIISGGDTWYVITFPTEKKTYAYDYKRDIFSEWSYFNPETGSREHFLGITAAYIKSWNRHLVGSRKSDGYIYLSSKAIYKDGSDPSVWEIRTGWEGDGEWFKPRELRLKLKRGAGAAGTTPEPFMEVYYRDNNSVPQDKENAWKGPRSVNLGQLGEEEQIYRIHQLGRYRQRQYRFLCSGDVPIVLIGAQEIG